MIKTIKTVFYTLAVVFVFTFSYVVWHTYNKSVAESKEIETQILRTIRGLAINGFGPK